LYEWRVGYIAHDIGCHATFRIGRYGSTVMYDKWSSSVAQSFEFHMSGFDHE